MSKQLVTTLYNLTIETIVYNNEEDFFHLVAFLESLGKSTAGLKRAWNWKANEIAAENAYHALTGE